MTDQAPPTIGAFTPKISPTLLGLVRPLTDCQRHPDNARTHDIPAIQASLNEHGQRTAIVVQASTGYVVKGNGTWEAAWKLGWGEIAQDWQDLDDDEAYKYLLADNRASDKSGYDNKKLIAGLEKMVAGPGLEGTLWQIDELEDMIAAEDAVPQVEAGFTGGFAETAEAMAARAALGEEATAGQKRREMPIVLTVADHALFVGWLSDLRKKWGLGGATATVYEAVRRQAELEAGGVALTGDVVRGDSRAAERYAALREFRDLIATLGADKEYKGSWLLGQLQASMAATNYNPNPVVSPLREKPETGDEPVTEALAAALEVPLEVPVETATMFTEEEVEVPVVEPELGGEA